MVVALCVKIFHVRNLLNALKCPLLGVYVIYFGSPWTGVGSSCLFRSYCHAKSALMITRGIFDERKMLELYFRSIFVCIPTEELSVFVVCLLDLLCR